MYIQQQCFFCADGFGSHDLDSSTIMGHMGCKMRFEQLVFFLDQNFHGQTKKQPGDLWLMKGPPFFRPEAAHVTFPYDLLHVTCQMKKTNKSHIQGSDCQVSCKDRVSTWQIQGSSSRDLD